MRAPGFTCSDVGHVHLQHREGHGLDGVVQRHTVLGQASRVDQCSVRLVDVLVQLVDQSAFMVGLEGFQPHTQLGGQRLQAVVDLGQGGGAVARAGRTGSGSGRGG